MASLVHIEAVQCEDCGVIIPSTSRAWLLKHNCPPGIAGRSDQ